MSKSLQGTHDCLACEDTGYTDDVGAFPCGACHVGKEFSDARVARSVEGLLGAFVDSSPIDWNQRIEEVIAGLTHPDRTQTCVMVSMVVFWLRSLKRE